MVLPGLDRCSLGSSRAQWTVKPQNNMCQSNETI